MENDIQGGFFMHRSCGEFIVTMQLDDLKIYKFTMNKYFDKIMANHYK